MGCVFKCVCVCVCVCLFGCLYVYVVDCCLFVFSIVLVLFVDVVCLLCFHCVDVFMYASFFLMYMHPTVYIAHFILCTFSTLYCTYFLLIDWAYLGHSDWWLRGSRGCSPKDPHQDPLLLTRVSL